MIAFGDSSALVKLYADEADAETVRAIDTLAVSQLCRVEVPAAIWRKHRVDDLPAEDAQLLTAAFEADYDGADGDLPRFIVVTVTEDIVADAARLCAVHPLRAYDAVQLASALTIAALDPTVSAFAAFDRIIRRAAAAEGLTLLPAELP
jgi:predicted nucleic acid-binding protein